MSTPASDKQQSTLDQPLAASTFASAQANSAVSMPLGESGELLSRPGVMPAMDSSSPFRIDVNPAIHLSEIRADDEAAFVRHLNDEAIYRQTLRIPFPYSQADAAKFIQIAASATARHGHPVHFAVRDSADRLIGGCGFDGLAYSHRAEIGYWLAKEYWGQGIMTDVVRAACGFAMEQWKLVRITAHVFDFNIASARVLEKCGFTLEGFLRKHHRKDGAFINSKLYGLVH